MAISVLVGFDHPGELPLITGKIFIVFNKDNITNAPVSSGLTPFLSLLQINQVLFLASYPEFIGQVLHS